MICISEQTWNHSARTCISWQTLRFPTLRSLHGPWSSGWWCWSSLWPGIHQRGTWHTRTFWLAWSVSIQVGWLGNSAVWLGNSKTGLFVCRAPSFFFCCCDEKSMHANLSPSSTANTLGSIIQGNWLGNSAVWLGNSKSGLSVCRLPPFFFVCAMKNKCTQI